jgi:hypothetical protein
MHRIKQLAAGVTLAAVLAFYAGTVLAQDAGTTGNQNNGDTQQNNNNNSGTQGNSTSTDASANNQNTGSATSTQTSSPSQFNNVDNGQNSTSTQNGLTVDQLLNGQVNGTSTQNTTATTTNDTNATTTPTTNATTTTTSTATSTATSTPPVNNNQGGVTMWGTGDVVGWIIISPYLLGMGTSTPGHGTTTAPSNGNGSATGTQITYMNGYPMVGGNYIDCNGNIDNDPAHHTTNPNDTDPAHNVGKNCPGGAPQLRDNGYYMGYGNNSMMMNDQWMHGFSWGAMNGVLHSQQQQHHWIIIPLTRGTLDHLIHWVMGNQQQ